MAWLRLIEWDRCPEGRGVFIEAAHRELAVFRLSEPPYVAVIDNTCPHAGGNLSGGTLEGTVVTCPWHEWPFEVRTGVCTLSPNARVRTYPSELRDQVVWADLS